MGAELEAALAAAEKALALVAARKGAAEITLKGERDLATATDVAAEDVIRGVLLSRFPHSAVVGEERGGEAPSGGDQPYWLVDPICGTRNFASDLPLYAVNITCVREGQAVASVVADGATGNRYVAQRGGGAQLLTVPEARTLWVTDTSETIVIEPGAVAPGAHHARCGAFARDLLEQNRWDVRILGSSLSLAYLASGRVAGYLLFQLSSPVHTAAGCLLAEEAGAVVTDLTGRPWSLESRQLLAAATPALHRELLTMVAAGK
jgi:myo-inositol-1(or 4)-monophosphatase